MLQLGIPRTICSFAHGRNVGTYYGVAKISERLQTTSSIANGQVYIFRLGFYCVLQRRRIDEAQRLLMARRGTGTLSGDCM
jgi:hypothetical protein